MPQPDISIIIVSYNTKDLLVHCLESIEAGRGGLVVETIVVDNASTDGSRDAARKDFLTVKVISNDSNPGFAAANNTGLESASGRYLLLLNSDAELRRDSLKLMLDFMDSHPDAGAIGPRLVYSDGTTQPSADSFPNLMTDFLHLFGFRRLIPGEAARRLAAPVLSRVGGKTVGTYFKTYSGGFEPVEVDCVSGACLMVRAELIEKVGGLDQGYFMYMEDMDWCVRIKAAGASVFYLPEVEVIHHVGQSGEIDVDKAENLLVERYKSRLYFFRKHRGAGALFVERIMMIKAFALRWPFSQHKKAYSQIIRIAMRREP